MLSTTLPDLNRAILGRILAPQLNKIVSGNEALPETNNPFAVNGTSKQNVWVRTINGSLVLKPYAVSAINPYVITVGRCALYVILPLWY